MINARRISPRRSWYAPALLLAALTTAAVAPSVRAAATTYTVTTAADSGPGSLRQAIQDANANPGADTIIFSIGAGAVTIALQGELPHITDAVMIDGATQPGYAGTPLVTLDGSAAQTWATGIILHGSSTVKALSIGRFGYAGVFLYGGGNLVQDCYLGLDAAGTTARANGTGVFALWDRSGPANTLRGNVISGNLNCGVQADGPLTPPLHLEGNRIGTNASGTTAVPNQAHGIKFYAAPNHVVGGTSAAVRNLISGNRASGIALEGGTSGATIQGNYIGTTAAGAAALPNGAHGIAFYSSSGHVVGGTANGAGNLISGNSAQGVSVEGTSTGIIIQGNRIGTDALGAAAVPNRYSGVLLEGRGNTVGGSSAGAQNLLSGNTEFGVVVVDSAATGNLIQGNRIGTTADGAAALSNGRSGIVLAECPGNVVSGNLLSGNRAHGIELWGHGASGNAIAGNLVGTEASGAAPLGNGDKGVVFAGAPNNRIGGTTPESRNIISGNVRGGIYLGGSGATGNRIEGNYIGSDGSGVTALGNQEIGITVDDDASATVIGGSASESRNLISGNRYGVIIATTSDNNQILGNYIGTEKTGTAAMANREHGVMIQEGSQGNLVSGNLVSGNGNSGVVLINPGTSGNTVRSNRIGTNAAGTGPLGNTRFGVAIWDGEPSGNTIGGTAPGEGNRVAYNGLDGILVLTGTGNPLLGNLVYANGALGIDLGWNGITANDAGDADTGPNTLQNYPVLTSVTSASGVTTVKGSLASAPSRQYRLEFFGSAVGDPSGSGEAEQYLGSTTVTTSAAGTVSFTAALPVGIAGGTLVTATATDPGGNTSEFAVNRANLGPPDATPPTIQLTAQGINSAGKAYVQFTVRDTGSGLASIVPTIATNCILDIPTFVPGTTAGVVLTATKVDSSRGARIELRATDCSGNSVLGDPIIAELRIPKNVRSVTRQYSGIPHAERYVTVENGRPGMKQIIVQANAGLPRLQRLKPGGVETLDVADAMVAGDRNVITVGFTGAPGSTALLLIADLIPGGDGAAPASIWISRIGTGSPASVNREWGRTR